MFWPQHMTTFKEHMSHKGHIQSKNKLKNETRLCINADNLIGNKIYIWDSISNVCIQTFSLPVRFQF